MFWQIAVARPLTLSSASLTELLFRIETQIRLFIFGKKFRHDNFVSRSTDLYLIILPDFHGDETKWSLNFE